MKTTPIDTGLVQLDRNDRTYLAVEVGSSGRTFGLRKLTESSGPRGWIVNGPAVDKWDTFGIVEHEGSVFLYGANLGVTPLSAVMELPEDEALRYIERLAQALDVLTSSDRCPKRIHLRSVLFLDTGGILFLGNQVVERVSDMSSEPERIQEIEQLNHPDLEGPANATFALNVLLYRTISHHWPFTAPTEEDVHTHIRESHAMQPTLLRPEIDPRVASTLVDSLRKPGSRSFEEWIRDIHDWRDSGYTRTVSEQERSEILQKAETIRASMNKSLYRREMVRKHWKQAVVITLAVIVAGSIPMSMLRNHLAPRRTAGMSPQEVVESFLFGQNTLDHDLMEDAVIDGAGRQYVREATNLFVVSRMRMSVEMDGGIIDPVTWTENGRPELEPGRWVYGVVNAVFEALPAPEGTTEFLVTYERWSPDQDAQGDPDDIDLETPLGFAGTLREDIFRLRQDGEDWVIFEIETVSRTPIEGW